MSLKKTLNQRIDQYILDNPKQPKETGYYSKVASLFGIHPEKARKRWRMLNAKSTTANYIHVHPLPEQPTMTVTSTNTSDTATTYIWTPDGSQFDAVVEEKIENLEDLIRVCNIDTDRFDITTYSVKSYKGWTRDANNENVSKQLYSVKASLKAKKIDTNIEMQKQLILDEIKTYVPKAPTVPKVKAFTQSFTPPSRDCALEINIPDLHIGKLAWGKETGEDYDIKIAVARYKKAVTELLSRVNPFSIEKFILPVGNDMINIDNKASTTTGGTPQSCDSRFGKMFQTAKDLLIETIDELTSIAPVDVIIIPGNHDTVAMFTLGEVLDAWYHSNDNVNVSNTHAPRKYYQYGKNLIMYTHGHNEKMQDLGIICATEQPQLWAATKFRRVHVGHLHHSRQIKFTDIQEYPGFTVKVLNSLSANDAWHSEKGYNSLKGAEAFLYNKDKGLLANYYYLNQ